MNKPAVTPPITLAYLAGFIDGDGSISIVTRNDGQKIGYRPKLTVYNCNPEMVEMMNSAFGVGKVRAKKTGKARDTKWRPVYEWSIVSKKAVAAIHSIDPYLITKKRQSRLILRFDKINKKYNKTLRRWHPDLDHKCLRIFGKLKDECNAINRRGLGKARRKRIDLRYPVEALNPYFAGLLDSDGSFNISGKMCIPKINLTSNDLRIIRMFHSLYGGSWYIRSRKHKGWNTTYHCDITQRAAKPVLQKIIPYLRLKKKQAKLLVALANIREHFRYKTRWCQVARAKKWQVYSALKENCSALNQRAA